MFLKYDHKFIYIAVYVFLQLCYCQRNESSITKVMGKKYMVYFIQSPFTKNFQESWTCSGALVTQTQILTAAACLVETENIYAIAGYNKYISSKDIEKDECTRTKKQRVIKIVLPTDYKLDYALRLNLNIGIAVVEKPYNFSDVAYLTHCSYEPQPILVNFDSKHKLVNTSTIALEWGPITNKPEFTQETTDQFLQETPAAIVDKKKCTNIFDTPEIVHIIDKYHLCGSNYFEEDKNNTEHVIRPFKNCKMKNYGSGSENNDDNNLGSPLIKLIDDVEVIIGIKSSSNMNGECNEPVLYVSTAASSKLIKCLLETNVEIRQLCNLKSNNEQYEIREIDINWPESQVLETLITQTTTGCINCTNDTMYATQQQQSTHLDANDHVHTVHNKAYARVHPIPYQGYAHQRANVLSILSRPQFELGSRDRKNTYKVEQQSGEYELSLGEHYKENKLRPQHNQSTPSSRESSADYQQQQRTQENLQYQQPPYQQYDSQQREQVNTRLKQKNERADYQQQQRTLENVQYQQPPYQQYDSQQREQVDTRLKQKNERPYEIPENLPLFDPYGLPNAQQVHRQFEPQLGQQFNQPPSQYQPAPYKSTEGQSITQQYDPFPEIFNDQSREHRESPYTEPSKSYMAQIEAFYHKPLALTHATDQTEEDSSFDQIIAQLNGPPSASPPHINTSRHGNTIKKLIDHIFQHNTKPDEPYKENNQQYDVSIPKNQEVSHLGEPVRSDEVIIRPQIPVNNRNYDI